MGTTAQSDLQGLEPSFRNQVEKWLAAGDGAFWIQPGGGYRTHQRQIELRRINGCPDLYSSPSYTCRVPTAIPGQSRHEKGQAVDIKGDYTLAKKLAPLYGLTDISREKWHFQSTNPSRQTSVYAGSSVQMAKGTDGAVNNDSDCFIRMPEVKAGAKNVPIIGPVIDLLPGDQSVTIGGQCLFTRSNARGLIGAVSLTAGVLIIALGITLLVKVETVPMLTGIGARQGSMPSGWRPLSQPMPPA